MAVTSPTTQQQNSAPGLALLVGLPMTLMVFLFIAMPWSVQHKMHLALHGLCAQRPSHTLHFGDRGLPYDARMTGIYLGALVTIGVLVAARAHRNARTPTWTRLLILGLLSGVMAADGFNSLLEDLKLWHPYTTPNWLRLVTGMGAGIVLGFALVFLIGITLWRQPFTSRETFDDWRLLIRIMAILIALSLLFASRSGFLYWPMAITLMLATVLVLTMLSLVVIVVMRQQEFRFANLTQVGLNLPLSLIAAGLIMAALSLGRIVLERLVGGTPLQ